MNIRIFLLIPDSGILHPTKTGVTLTFEEHSHFMILLKTSLQERSIVILYIYIYIYIYILLLCYGIILLNKTKKNTKKYIKKKKQKEEMQSVFFFFIDKIF